jgi:hypothetical protein
LQNIFQQKGEQSFVFDNQDTPPGEALVCYRYDASLLPMMGD